ncbi:hypothetical protein ACUV84_003459 [Puccinellia chinampoensis]
MRASHVYARVRPPLPPRRGLVPAAASVSVFLQIAALADAAMAAAMALSSYSLKKRLAMVGSKAAAGKDVQSDASQTAEAGAVRVPRQPSEISGN